MSVKNLSPPLPLQFNHPPPLQFNPPLNHQGGGVNKISCAILIPPPSKNDIRPLNKLNLTTNQPTDLGTQKFVKPQVSKMLRSRPKPKFDTNYYPPPSIRPLFPRVGGSWRNLKERTEFRGCF